MAHSFLPLFVLKQLKLQLSHIESNFPCLQDNFMSSFAHLTLYKCSSRWPDTFQLVIFSYLSVIRGCRGLGIWR